MNKSTTLLFSLLALFATWSTTTAQDFDRFFDGQTLRLDYQMAGNSKSQAIYLDQLVSVPGWHGKRSRLAQVPVHGSGEITMRDHKTGQVIYRQCFSTLFQEWLSSPEAQATSKSFETVLLMPMPRDTAIVTIELLNNYHNTMASLTHQVVPTDILIRKAGHKPATPYRTLQTAHDTTRCINIAYIAEGYTASEMPLFRADAQSAMEALFAYEPFKSMRHQFNIVAVEAVSQESGTSEPSKGIWKNTALHSHFDTFYSNRYLTTLHLKDMHNLLAGIPYEHIIVLVNSDRYGGGGILNSYNLTSTHHKHFKPVVVHEFGHSFAGLGDEYAYETEENPIYPSSIEPWEPNLTTLANFKSKWADMVTEGTPIPTPENEVKAGTIGAYEGAGYSLKGVYRPSVDCRMRTNKNPDFCPVCTRAIKQLIDFYTQ